MDIIIDHTTIEDKFVILQIVMRIGKRSVPLWYKVFRYKEEGNKSFTYVKEGLNFVYSILKPYNFEVTLLADRGFKSLDLFKFIKDSDSDDPWYIINNIGGPKAILRYKRRFEIEETFKDFKSGGFNLEETWSNNITFIKNLYLCISIAYYFVISIGTICMKNKKNKIISATKKLKGKEKRVYSLFRAGLKWIKRSYYQCRKKYYLKFSFVIYEL